MKREREELSMTGDSSASSTREINDTIKKKDRLDTVID
jgi:hypothetical protein